jgi:ribosome-associated protein
MIPNSARSNISLKDQIMSSLDDRKAQDMVMLDLTNKTAIADAMIVVTGTSQRHIVAMAEGLQRDLSGSVDYCRVEGLPHADWVLLDFGDIIVHLFRQETRRFYELEKLWS